jgi:hypothetical protein
MTPCASFHRGRASPSGGLRPVGMRGKTVRLREKRDPPSVARGGGLASKAIGLALMLRRRRNRHLVRL